MWRLKGCPRCRGDMQLDRDRNGRHEWCLQCGHQTYIKDTVMASRRTGEKKRLTRSTWKLAELSTALNGKKMTKKVMEVCHG